MKLIYYKRSQLKNWKVKVHHQRCGNMFYTIWYKSIFGFWRCVKTPCSYGDGMDMRTIFDSNESAKKYINDAITENVTLLGNVVDRVEEIKFD